MPAYDDKSLYEALKELGVIDPKVLFEKFEEARNQKTSFEDLLLKNDLIGDGDLGKVISGILGVPLVRLSEIAITDEVLNILPEVVARNYWAITFKKDADGISLATSNPPNETIKNYIVKKTSAGVKVFFATKRDIEEAFNKYTKDITTAFQKVMAENIQKFQGSQKNELPIEEITGTIISYAYENKASDIHIEPQEENSLVRYRIDGVLHDIVSIPKNLHGQIVNRIKVLSKLRTDEHLSAKDGKMIFKTPKENLDLRVSLVPVVSGEKAVLRLLSERSRQFGLADLGISTENMAKITSAYQSPNGMILATGPTGCGKTTTLYAILKILNKRGVNIMTIEDPVEYDIEGVNQIQVNSKTNLTFAEGLKSVVRQDPDIILLGEIRDAESAGIAVNSALTGHLVLSTLHTNDAATTFPRLLDFNVEPFLIGSTVRVVIAQRLVRKICPACRVSTPTTITQIKQRLDRSEVDKAFATTSQPALYHGKGCPVCFNSGYVERIGIFEVLPVDDDIRQAISEKKDSSLIAQTAVKNGMKTLLEDGLEKVKNGITTIEEVIRVTKE